MRRLLLCAGVHGKPEALEWLRQVVEERRPDGLFFAGGIVDPARRYAVKETAWCLTAEDTAFAEQFFATLGRLEVFCAVIPGRAGEPLDEFFRLAIEAELTFPNVHVVHATLVEEGDMAVCGLGRNIAEGPLIGCECCTRTSAEYFLRPLWRTDCPRKVLLLPAPPPGPLGGLEGEALIGDLIDSFHPELCVVAGVSERRGSQRVANSLIVNPGRLADGWAAWLDWERAAGDRLEFLNVKTRAVALTDSSPRVAANVELVAS